MLQIEVRSLDIRVCNEKRSAGEKCAVEATAQDAWNDIVEVKNLSGRPQRYSPGSWCVKLGVCVCVCVEAGDGV